MKKGFTLMELLVVIMIVAIVSVASTVSFSNIDDATNKKELENKYIEIQRAASLYLDLHSERLDDFVNDNVASIPLSVLEQEGYLTDDLSDPTGGPDISKNYSVQIVIGDNSVETCIVNIKPSGNECIANKFGEKRDCCTISSTSIASEEEGSYDYEETESPPSITDANTGVTKFDKGRVVNAKMKSLAAGSTISYMAHDKSIKGFKNASSLKSGFVASEDNTVSPISESYDGKPIYIWFDNGTIYFYSEANTVYLNADSYAMFERFNALKDISGLANVNAKNAETLQNYFLSCYMLEDISPIKNWNVSKVKSLRSFINVTDDDISESNKSGSLKTLEPLTNWNVKNVIDMKYAFQDQPKLKNLKGLQNWNTESLKYLTGTFALSTESQNKNITSNLTDISALNNWDTKSVTSLHYTFARSKLSSLNGLQKWDTSSVTNMQSLFYNNYYLKDISALENWKTGEVKNMSYMFMNNISLSNVSALQRWDVRKVKNFRDMFNVDNETIKALKSVGNIRSVAPLANWEPSSVEDTSWMFEDQIKVDDFSVLNSWAPYLTNVTKSEKTFGLSSEGKTQGYACNNNLAELRNTLRWPENVTSVTNFYMSLDKCHD